MNHSTQSKTNLSFTLTHKHATFLFEIKPKKKTINSNTTYVRRIFTLKKTKIVPSKSLLDFGTEKESIRASRLSNREVMLSSTAVLHNMNLPSSSSSASIDYLIRNRKPCASNKRGQSITDQSNAMVKAKQTTSTCQSNHNTSKSSADDTEAETNSSSNIDNDSNDQDNTDLSQYELDIVNKYLNEMSSSNDESNDYDKNISENQNENQLNSIESSSMNSHHSSGGDGGSGSGTDSINDNKNNTQSNQSNRLNTNDQCSTADVSIESDVESPTQSQSQSQSHDASTSAMQQSFPVSSASDEIRACTQTSRQIVFDQTNQIDAMINPTRYTDYLGHTHNDVNNNNLSLSSNNNNNTNTTNHTDSHSSNQGRHYSSERRHYGMTGRTNPTSNRLTITNIPIIVGITSCVWGLFFYAVKCFFFSDLT